MLSFKPFWEMLEKCSESQYTLIHNYGFSSSTIHRLKHNKPVSSDTLNKLCFVLNCQPGELMCYIPDSPEYMKKSMKLSHNKFQELQAKYTADTNSQTKNEE
jgi:DNA-binding Xre family transcriptional regulator